VAVLSYAAQWGVVFVVGIVLSHNAVAIMNALLRLLAPLQFVILTLDYFVAPRFARGNDADIARVRRRSIITGLALVAPYALALLSAPGLLLSYIYGPNYGAYGNELRILIAGLLFQMAMGPNGILLNMLSHDREMTVSVVLRICINLGIQMILFVRPALWIAAASYSGALLGQCIYLRITAARATKSRFAWEARPHAKRSTDC
jgi:O-antigen/teichoic acid export membrane protein